MTEDSVCNKCYEELKRAMGLQIPWHRLIERVGEMVKDQDMDTMSRHRIEEMEAQLVKLLEDRKEAAKSDSEAIAKARAEGERKGWEDCLGNLGMFIAMDYGVVEKLRELLRDAEVAVKEAEIKVASGETYYDLLKFRAPEGVKIGYEDSDSSKRDGK